MSNWLDYFFNSIGVAGTLSFLWAYFMLQRNLWKHDGFAYLFANFLGAVCLIISLLWHFNLASFLLECAWLMISGYGLYKWHKQRPQP
jgi:hypothetical protein